MHNATGINVLPPCDVTHARRVTTPTTWVSAPAFFFIFVRSCERSDGVTELCQEAVNTRLNGLFWTEVLFSLFLGGGEVGTMITYMIFHHYVFWIFLYQIEAAPVW